MAIENAKTLQVRIKNKYDSYDNWASSGLVLEAGEIAIAYSDVDVKIDNGTVKQPLLLMKVGDGNKTFANLPWLSARAADVLEACKSNDGLTAFINNVIANTDFASNEAMTGLVERIDAVENDLNTENTGLKAKMTAAEAEIEAIKDKFGYDTVALEIEAAIAGLKLAETYAAKKHAHTKSEITDFAHNHEMNEIDGLSDEFAKKVDKETGKSLVADSEVARLAAMSDGANKVEASTNGKIKIDGVDTVVYTHPDKHAMGDITGLDTALAGKQDVIPENTYDAHGSAAGALEDANDYTDSELERLVGDASVATQIENAFKNEDGSAKYALAADLDAEAQAARAAEESLQNQINTIMSNPDAEGAINSINEFTQYVKDHGTIAEGMRSDIDDLKGDTHTHANKSLLDTYAQTEANLADAVAKKHSHANSTELDKIAAGDKAKWDTAAGKAHEHTNKAEIDLIATGDKAKWDAMEGNANQYTDDQIDEWVGDTKVADQISAAIEALKIGDYAKAQALTEAINQHNTDKAALETEIGKKANDADLAAIAKTGSTDDLVMGNMVLVFDCGSASDLPLGDANLENTNLA